jgi:PAS domain S-box-containing protein
MFSHTLLPWAVCPDSGRGPGGQSAAENNSGAIRALRPWKKEASLSELLNPDEAQNVPGTLAEAFAPLIQSSGIKFAPPESETRYKTLVEQTPAVIFVAHLGEGTGEVYVSPHIERILGFTQEEWLDSPIRWYSQIHHEDRARWSLEVADLFLTGRTLRSTYRVLARDGHVVWFNCEAKMVREEHGNPWFIYGVGLDVTDLKEVEEALRKSRDELELRVEQRTSELARSNADLEQFAYAASHDLQEPVRNIAIYSQLLKRRYRGKLDAEADFFLDTVAEGAARASALIRNLLVFAQISNQASVLDEEPTDANSLVAKIAGDLEAAIRESGAVIETGPLPGVCMREAHLRQIFQNLISNAIKYRSEAPPLIEISARPCTPGFHLFAVRDNGIGIDAQYHEAIFGLFKRLRGGEEETGTGLGLAICKRSVERSGGTIWVQSEPGKGSVFFFTAPTRREAAAQTTEYRSV